MDETRAGFRSVLLSFLSDREGEENDIAPFEFVFPVMAVLGDVMILIGLDEHGFLRPYV